MEMTDFAKTSENARPRSLQQTVRARPIFEIGDLTYALFLIKILRPLLPLSLGLNF